MTNSRCKVSSVRPSRLGENGFQRWLLRTSLVPVLVLGCDLNGPPEPDLSGQEYYEVRLDARRCASPRCGGYFVKALNQSQTLCFDGSQAEQCYVAEADFTTLGEVPSGRTIDIVRGRLNSFDVPAVGQFGRLIAEEGWAAVGTATGTVEATFTYYRVADNGIRCVTTPCFSVAAESLNLRTQDDFSAVNFDNAGLSNEQQAEAIAALTAGKLLANGLAVPDPGQTSIGTALAVSGVFLPLLATTCTADADCDDGQWCRGQASAAQCVPFAQTGDSCEGFLPPEFIERCAPGLQCDLQDPTGDAGGVCRTVCQMNSDCSDEQYCADEGLCHDDGKCEALSDCQLPGNDYPVMPCAGVLTCSAIGDGDFGTQQGACGINCGIAPAIQ